MLMILKSKYSGVYAYNYHLWYCFYLSRQFPASLTVSSLWGLNTSFTVIFLLLSPNMDSMNLYKTKTMIKAKSN